MEGRGAHAQGDTERVGSEGADSDGGESEEFVDPWIAEARQKKLPEQEQRIARAKAYAAWEFDGKPLSSKAQREEMGVRSPDIPGFTDQAKLWAKRGEQ